MNCVCCVKTFASALEEWFDLRPELSVLVYFGCEMNSQVESWITCISCHERSRVSRAFKGDVTSL